MTTLELEATYANTVILILAVLVVLCLISLAVGKRGSLVSGAIRSVVSVASHPFWLALDAAEESYDYAAASCWTTTATTGNRSVFRLICRGNAAPFRVQGTEGGAGAAPDAEV